MVDVTTHEGRDSRLEELISAHIRNLQNDFRRMLDEVVVPDPPDPQPPTDLQATLSRLKESVDAILAARNQREMAGHLLDAVAAQSGRAALLLARGEALRGFETRGFAGDAAEISGFRAEPGADDPLAAARTTTQHVPGSALEGTALAVWHGETPPAQVCLAPVTVGGRTVAVVYADSGTGDADEAGRIQPEAVEILASMAGLFLDRLRHASAAALVSPAGDAGTRDDGTDETEATLTPPGDLDPDTDGPAASLADAEGGYPPEGTSMYGAEPAEVPDLQDEPEIPDTLGIDDVAGVPLVEGDDTQPRGRALRADDTPPGAAAGTKSTKGPSGRAEDRPGTSFDPEATRLDTGSGRFDPGATVQISLPSNLQGDDDESAAADGPAASGRRRSPSARMSEGDATTMEFDPMAEPDDEDDGMPGIRTPELRTPVETVSEPSGQELLAGPPSARDTARALESPSGESGESEDALLELDWTPPAGGDSPLDAPETPEETLADMAASAPEVSASDVPANEDAERFARLLVSEIVLYNEASVQAGRKGNDLYRRLKDSIDRSRDAFCERFGDELAVLFEREIVRTLAGGDAARMGDGFTRPRA